MVKCFQVGCNEQGFKYEGYDGYLCPYHASQIEEILRRERQDRNSPQYEQCPGCIFGKRNKKTKECNESFCRFYPKKCQYCGKAIATGQTYWPLKNDKKIVFCSKLHGETYLKKKEEEELERLNREAKKYDEEMEELKKDLKEADQVKQKWQKIVTHVKTGKSLTELWTNWEEEIADLSADEKSLYREYQKNIEEKAKILKDKNNYQQSLGDSSSQSNDNSDNSSNNSGYFSPSNNNSSDNSTSWVNCVICEKSYSSEQEHDSQNPNCREQGQIWQEALAKIERGILNEHAKLNGLPSQKKNALIALQDLKISKRWVDIDNLDVSQEVKDNLRKMRDELGVKKDNSSNNEKNDLGIEKENPAILPKILIFGVLFLILAVVFIMVLRNKRLKKNK